MCNHFSRYVCICKLKGKFKVYGVSAYKPRAYLSSLGFYDEPICGRAYSQRGLYAGQKQVSETTNIIRQNENLYMKKENEKNA